MLIKISGSYKTLHLFGVTSFGVLKSKHFPHKDIEDKSVAKDVLKACYEGGSRLMEFTNRGDFALEVFTDIIKYSISELPGMILGVGSITDATAASQYMVAGTNFVVPPVFREDIARICNRRKLMWSAGCSSLTEIATAEEFGCELVKLFPGDVLGPKFVKSIKGPQPWTSVMPTGGVSMEYDNLKSWFDSGVTCVGMGSKLISNDILENKDYDLLKKNVKETLEIIKSLNRKNKSL